MEKLEHHTFFPGYIISRLRPHWDDMGMETRWFPKEHDLQLIDSISRYFPRTRDTVMMISIS